MPREVSRENQLGTTNNPLNCEIRVKAVKE
jgi:hypothetical protein